MEQYHSSKTYEQQDLPSTSPTNRKYSQHQLYFKCQVCGNTSYTQSQLDYHLATYHHMTPTLTAIDYDDKLICPVHPYFRFYRQEQLNQHNVSYHKQQTSTASSSFEFICKQCNCKFATVVLFKGSPSLLPSQLRRRKYKQ